MILTLDEIGFKLAKRNLSQDIPVKIVGNHAINGNNGYLIPDKLASKIEELRCNYSPVICYAGAGIEDTLRELLFLKKCLKLTPGNWILLPRFHPKLENVFCDKKKENTYGDYWTEMLDDFGEKVLYFEVEKGEWLASLADITISGFSTLLTTALFSQKNTLSITTPENRKLMKQYTSLDSHPLVKEGLIPEIEAPCDLTPFFTSNPAPAKTRIKPFNSSEALLALEQLN